MRSAAPLIAESAHFPIVTPARPSAEAES
jgi:hypothetical protein